MRKGLMILVTLLLSACTSTTDVQKYADMEGW